MLAANLASCSFSCPILPFMVNTYFAAANSALATATFFSSSMINILQLPIRRADLAAAIFFLFHDQYINFAAANPASCSCSCYFLPLPANHRWWTKILFNAKEGKFIGQKVTPLFWLFPFSAQKNDIYHTQKNKIPKRKKIDYSIRSEFINVIGYYSLKLSTLNDNFSES